MTKQLKIMRGVSGSGKSTLAHNLSDEAKIFSTDDYFMVDGEYRFNPRDLGKAHAWNVDLAESAMAYGVPFIVIDNTNTQAWEARLYCVAAQEFGYEVEFIETDTPWCKDAAKCAEKNTHGVPQHAIQAMLDRWEDDLTVEKCLAAKAPWEK